MTPFTKSDCDLFEALKERYGIKYEFDLYGTVYVHDGEGLQGVVVGADDDGKFNVVYDQWNRDTLHPEECTPCPSVERAEKLLVDVAEKIWNDARFIVVADSNPCPPVTNKWTYEIDNGLELPHKLYCWSDAPTRWLAIAAMAQKLMEVEK